MFCANCGAQNAENVKFCKNCGAAVNVKLSETATETANNEVATNSETAETTNTATAAFEDDFTNFEITPKQNKPQKSAKPINKALLAIPAAGIVLVVVGLMFLLLPNFGGNLFNNGNEPPNVTAENPSESPNEDNLELATQPAATPTITPIITATAPITPQTPAPATTPTAAPTNPPEPAATVPPLERQIMTPINYFSWEMGNIRQNLAFTVEFTYLDYFDDLTINGEVLLEEWERFLSAEGDYWISMTTADGELDIFLEILFRNFQTWLHRANLNGSALTAVNMVGGGEAWQDEIHAITPIQNFYITTSNVNLREEPSLESNVITVIPADSEVWVLGRLMEDSDWFFVEIDINVGYMWAEFLAQPNEPAEPIEPANQPNEPAAEPAQTPTPAETPIPTQTPSIASFIPATFQIREDGYIGEIIVQVSFSESRIEEIHILSHSETETFFNMVVPTLTNRIIAAQSANVDIITGATATSRAIINAVDNLIEWARE